MSFVVRCACCKNERGRFRSEASQPSLHLPRPILLAACVRAWLRGRLHAFSVEALFQRLVVDAILKRGFFANLPLFYQVKQALVHGAHA